MTYYIFLDFPLSKGTTEATLKLFEKLFYFMHMFIASVRGWDNRFLQPFFSIYSLRKALDIFCCYRIKFFPRLPIISSFYVFFNIWGIFIRFYDTIYFCFVTQRPFCHSAIVFKPGLCSSISAQGLLKVSTGFVSFVIILLSNFNVVSLLSIKTLFNKKRFNEVPKIFVWDHSLFDDLI